MKIIVFLFCALLSSSGFSKEDFKSHNFIINEFSIPIPQNCIILSKNKTKVLMNCTDEGNGFSLRIDAAVDFSKNVILSQRRKNIINYNNGVFVEFYIGDGTVNFFYLTEYDIVLHGGSKYFLLKYSDCIINYLKKFSKN